MVVKLIAAAVVRFNLVVVGVGEDGGDGESGEGTLCVKQKPRFTLTEVSKGGGRLAEVNEVALNDRRN